MDENQRTRGKTTWPSVCRIWLPTCDQSKAQTTAVRNLSDPYDGDLAVPSHILLTSICEILQLHRIAIGKNACNFPHMSSFVEYKIYSTYWDILTHYNTCPKIWTSWFYYLWKNCQWVTNNVDHDQMLQNTCSIWSKSTLFVQACLSKCLE